MMMDYGWDGWGGGFWMIGGLLLMVGVIVLVVWAVMTLSRGSGQAPNQGSPRPTPTDILRERFARGEISEQEFEQAKKVLGPDR